MELHRNAKLGLSGRFALVQAREHGGTASMTNVYTSSGASWITKRAPTRFASAKSSAWASVRRARAWDRLVR